MTEVALTTLPAPPANAVEAANRLTALSENKEWADKLLLGDVATVKEFRDLTVMKANGDNVEIALAGVIPENALGFRDPEQVVLAETATHLRELGLSDGVVEQALRNEPLPQKEVDLAAAWKMRAMRDAAFTAKLLSGDPEARQRMTLANIVLSTQVSSL